MTHRTDIKHRFDKSSSPSVQNWKKLDAATAREIESNVQIYCGWGRLLFAHTFEDTKQLADTILEEKEDERDIAFYLRDPHVVLSYWPEKLFLDPSHTYRLWINQYKPGKSKPMGFVIRRAQTREDAKAINRIYASRRMVLADEKFIVSKRNSRALSFFVAEDPESHEILGTVMTVDHFQAFKDPENGSSLWCLAVDPQAPFPRVGEALVRHVVEHFLARGRSFVDLSVMHDNTQAIGLYEKLGFQRVPVFAVKKKNPINEPLFTGAPIEVKLNPYAQLIVKEARRRGISVEILDEQMDHFALRHGGRRVVCWESLSDLTSAIAMVRCDNKQLTRRILHREGLHVPAQLLAGKSEENKEFLKEQERIVVKPMRGEQGAGISVDIRTEEEMVTAIAKAKEVCEDVLLEEFIEGEDLRIIVIDGEVVAAAVRRPAQIIGTGQHPVRELIKKQSRRRSAATGGESRIPMDEETSRCVEAAGYTMDSVPEEGERIRVRKTANLHTGGTIHDVTENLHPSLASAAVKAASVLEIPLVGFDFMVQKVDEPGYSIIEANERPGLANHEPQPTAEKFVDFLFPQTVT